MTPIPADQPQGPFPEDGNPLQSIQTLKLLSTGPQSFSVPLSAKSIYFLSRGSYQSGTLHFGLAPEGADPNKIIVNVGLSKEDPAMAGHHKVCSLERNKKSEYGIGFYTPNTVNPNPPTLVFAVNVLIPKPSTSTPLLINNLTTALGNWGQTIDLNKLVNFKTASLTSNNGPVTINGTDLGNAKVTASQGPITGSFFGDQTLELTTSNAEINVTVTVLNSIQSTPANVRLTTSNGPITSSLFLMSTYAGALFNVTSTTTGGPLNISFPSAPTTLPFPVLKLQASTGNAPASVSLHPTYEGNINVNTTGPGNVPVLNVNPNVQDPSGQGRTRIVTPPTVSGSNLTASVGWARPSGPGTVELNTTNNGSVVVQL